MSDFRPSIVLTDLAASAVDFIVVGGIAAALWGSTRETNDLDVMCPRSESNNLKLAGCLTHLKARVTGSPNAPRPIDPRLLSGMKVVSFETENGALDVVFESQGITFEDVVRDAEEMDLEDGTIRVVGLATLIEMKRGAGRPKDREVIAELEALQELGAELH
ncbi:MAG: hypothetical protein QOE92_2482 [Chloroflexota bacterium]|jgi:hypothetical protein|nr:hypothetical protein [Chloroflexota bacterium]